MPEMQDIVAAGVKEQALIDKHLALAYKAAGRYSKVVENAVIAGMIPKALDAKKMLAESRVLPGKIAEAAVLGAELHISGTAVAVANDVDLGSPVSVGGVKIGGFHTEGGGGR
ncbi:hypothetical protein [Rhizobium sp. HT1-10]|uniref:hypothetical protein n=1 Tax=Rhizobium sp. HT1-10 TaxID=3111638 RepID=UPI003C230D3B